MIRKGLSKEVTFQLRTETQGKRKRYSRQKE